METFTPDPKSFGQGKDVVTMFEEGMCYRVEYEVGWMIFRCNGSAVKAPAAQNTLNDGRDNHRIFTEAMISTNGSSGPRVTYYTKPYVVGRKCRRATVEEETWYDECVRAGEFITKDEAVKRFETRYEI